MSFPQPEPGLVIRYSYLWLREHRMGREEGLKDRLCAIVLAARDVDGATSAVVLPITHSPPEGGAIALEMPGSVKIHLGLDSERSWVVLSENNQFTWPGPDVRRVGDYGDETIAYGFLPPKFFAEVRRRWLLLGVSGSRSVTRTE